MNTPNLPLVDVALTRKRLTRQLANHQAILQKMQRAGCYPSEVSDLVQEQIDLIRQQIDQLREPASQPDSQACAYCGSTAGSSVGSDGWERCNSCDGM